MGGDEGNRVRYHSLDALRAFMMLLGLVFHAQWMLQPTYFWNARADVQGHEFAHYFFGWVHVFRMQAFILIAGFFAHLLIAKRGVPSFLVNRTYRVLLPFVAAMVVFFPILRWQGLRGGIQTGRIQTSDGLWDHTIRHFSGLPEKIGQEWPYHFWFLETLCLLYLITLALRFVCQHVVDRSGALRAGIQRVFEVISESPWCIPTLSIPVAAMLLWDNTWFGITSGPLNPEWVGTFNYWFIFAVGWCLYVRPELITRAARFWKTKMVVGSVIALLLAGVFFNDWSTHRNRVGPSGVAWNLTAVADSAKMREELLAEDDSPLGELRAEVRSRISAEFLAFIRETGDWSSDQKFGVVDQFNSRIIDATDLATVERCLALGLDQDPRWGEWVVLPMTDRPESVRKPINEALLRLALPESVHAGTPRELGDSVAYFYAYALSTWLLIQAWLGFFEEYFSTQSQKVRYYSDAAYWLYILHVPVQFEMSLWMGDLVWPTAIKFLLYSAGPLVVGVPTYHYLVRSTWVGKWLNGRRYPREPFWQSAVLPYEGDTESGSK
tara:strand:- start:628 stop:2280 length:1653 start_codon:yes stop_codon:yes gene_type:complete